MVKARSRFQLCRWVGCDLWGEVLYSRKSLRPLFFAIYKPYRKRPRNFVLRVDIMRPQKKKRILSRFALAKLERRKLCAFYYYTPSQLRQLVLRYRYSLSGYNGFVSLLESQLHIILWRSSLFKNPAIIKGFIASGQAFVNNELVRFIGHSCQLYDLISFKNLSLTFFRSRLNKSIRLRESHLLINFRLPMIFLLENPDPIKLFYFFPVDYRYAFFSWRFRRR